MKSIEVDLPEYGGKSLKVFINELKLILKKHPNATITTELVVITYNDEKS